MKCPLCGSKNTQEIENLDVDIIKEFYEKEKGFDVSYLFQDKSLNYIHCKDCDMRFFRPVIEGDDLYYSNLQKEEWYFLHEDKTEFDFSKKYIKKTDSVLDIGSGRGAFKKYIDCAFYQGLELSHKAIDLAKQDGVNVINEAVQEHAEKNPEKYDVVVMFQVLEHISEMDSFLKSSIKCLKKGGYFIVAVPNNDSYLKYVKNNFLNMPPHHQNHFNQSSLRKLADLYNLKIVKEYKEKVTNIHKLCFYLTLKDLFYKKLCGVKMKSTDNSTVEPKGIKKILADIILKILRKISIHRYSDGNSIIFVYKK